MNLRVLLFFILSFFVILNNCKAQQNMPCGKLILTMAPRVSSQLESYRKICNKEQKTKGYRVQIHFGNSREIAKDIKTKFTTQFSNSESVAYELYQQPNFKIRVGDFRTHVEAYKFLKSIKSTFSSAYIVQDDINFPALD